MQVVRVPMLEAQPTPKIHRHSAYGVPTKSSRTQLAAIPNFSIPNTPNARHLNKEPPVLEASPIPTIVMTTPKRSQDLTLKGSRKKPPPALNLSQRRSCVNDIASPALTPGYTPTQASCQMIAQIMPAMIDIPPRSPGPITPSPRDSSHPLPQEQADQNPADSLETSPQEFRFPRRVSSMQNLDSFSEEIPEPPLRPAPLPPAAALMKQFPSHPLSPEEDCEDGTGSLKQFAMQRDAFPPTPPPANTKTKIRRPFSMQVETTYMEGIGPISSSRPSTSTSNSSTKRRHIARPVSQASVHSNGSNVTLVTPAMQRVRSAKALANRRSMPVLVNGPPPAPPPDYALPPLPMRVR